MKTWSRSFNIYLILITVLCCVGCASDLSKEEKAKAKAKKKDLSTLRIHLEVNQDGTGANGPVQVTNQKIQVNVEKEPFLFEDDVAEASLVDSVGGFAVQIRLTSHGALVLDMMSSSHKGQRMAILTQSKNKALTRSRWIAAPLIKNRIATGTLIFTPDMTRDEAEHMVNGLNNVAEKARKAASFF